MLDFRHRTVVITGAASGMGMAYAEEFAYLGARLAICDIDAGVLGVVAEELTKIPGVGEVLARVVDVSAREEVFAFAAEVERELGPAYVVINNAGVGGVAEPFYGMDLDAFERTMRINFYGVVYGTKAFLPQLVARGAGALVNVSSIFGFVGPPNAADYAASKFAVRGFTESLIAEFYGSDIQVHCLHPGGIDTQIARDQPDRRFAERMLVTHPTDVARHVIACLRSGRRRIVYGHQARRVWLGARVLPLRWMVSLFWREAYAVTDVSGYGAFNPGLPRRS